MRVGRTVLLADDQSSVRNELREILRQCHYTIVGEAANTDDALQKFETLRPDAVIMDVTLPGTLDALVAIDRMRRLDASAAILATGSASQNMIVMEALSMGAADFFLKPFKRRAVEDCLQRTLG